MGFPEAYSGLPVHAEDSSPRRSHRQAHRVEIGLAAWNGSLIAPFVVPLRQECPARSGARPGHRQACSPVRVFGKAIASCNQYGRIASPLSSVFQIAAFQSRVSVDLVAPTYSNAGGSDLHQHMFRRRQTSAGEPCEQACCYPYYTLAQAVRLLEWSFCADFFEIQLS